MDTRTSKGFNVSPPTPPLSRSSFLHLLHPLRRLISTPSPFIPSLRFTPPPGHSQRHAQTGNPRNKQANKTQPQKLTI